MGANLKVLRGGSSKGRFFEDRRPQLMKQWTRDAAALGKVSPIQQP
jgi:hypothetical protein